MKNDVTDQDALADRKLMDDPALARIGKNLVAAGKELQALATRHGRKLAFFCDDGSICVVDQDRDGEHGLKRGFSRQAELIDGGVIVRGYGMAGKSMWDGGGW